MAKSQKDSKERPQVSIETFYDLMFHKAITLEEAGVSEKIFAYWRAQNLIDFVPKGKWARLSYVQVIWLRVLSTLREFGCSIEILKKVHYYFYVRAYRDDVPRLTVKNSIEQLKKIELAGQLSAQENERLNYLQEILKDHKRMYILRTDVTYFSNLINECLSSGLETGILVFKDGTVAEYSYDTYYSEDKSKFDHAHPHIYIPLIHYLIEFINDESLSKFISPLQLLNENEYRVLRELRSNNVKEVRIEKKGKKIHQIDVTKEKILQGSEAQQLMETLGLHNYEKIVLETRDNTTISFKKTKKKRL